MRKVHALSTVERTIYHVGMSHLIGNVSVRADNLQLFG